MKKYFITGTDTNVGKTLVSSILTLALQGHYWKPIGSGLSDLQKVKELTQLPAKHFSDSSYAFKTPLSPDQAAKIENVTIDLSQCKMPITNEKDLIIEGAGGVFVPLNDEHFILDLMKQFNVPIVIVARGTVGTINHTLLTIEALRQQNLVIQGIIFSGELNVDSQHTIEKRAKVKTLFHVPHFGEISTETIKAWVHKHASSILESLA
jgi:dethiobiotin synthase